MRLHGARAPRMNAVGAHPEQTPGPWVPRGQEGRGDSAQAQTGQASSAHCRLAGSLHSLPPVPEKSPVLAHRLGAREWAGEQATDAGLGVDALHGRHEAVASPRAF